MAKASLTPQVCEQLKVKRERYAKWYRKVYCEGALLKKALRRFYIALSEVGTREGKASRTLELVCDHLHRRITTIAFVEGIAALFGRSLPNNAFIVNLDNYVKALYERHAKIGRLGALVDSFDRLLDMPANTQ